MSSRSAIAFCAILQDMEQLAIHSPGRQLSPEKAEAILGGAMQEFLACGYAATSMDRVAATAGVSKATIYSHFQDKEGLFNALIQQLVQKKFRSIFGPLDDRALQGDPAAVLTQIANNVLDSGMGDPQYVNFMRLIMGESGRFPELARTFVRNLEATACQFFRQYLNDNAERLHLPDPEASGRIFIGALVHYLIVQEMLHGKDIMPMERDRLIDSLIFHICPKQI
ncbi:TetR/AcrR family transcriptional regulator [Altericista sp. CCNU0014]|uniref:TetR/AcrR family transcriptional regulator n=1 Tax=Altericista sp. CCNU0014 TaxID=3082949 RepID=UPI00384D6B35